MTRSGPLESFYLPNEVITCELQANNKHISQQGYTPLLAISSSLAGALSRGRQPTAANLNMNPFFPNSSNNNVNSNLQFLLELQRQQQQQQQAQQRQFQANQQQQNGIPGLQALLAQERLHQQQQQLLTPSLLASLAGMSAPQQPTSEFESILRQRDSLIANQLLARQQNVDELLSSAAAAASSPARFLQQQTSTASTPLLSLFPNPNDSLQLLMQAASGQAGISGVNALLPPGSEAALPLEISSSQEQRTENSKNDEGSSEEEAKVSASDGKMADDSDSEEVEGAAEEEEDHPANDTFPFKLHRMLEHAEKNGLDDVISFTPDGRNFAIHKPREFVASIMPKYFTTSRMSSFQRQLNLYGFRRITEGRDKGAYYHKYFIHGRRGLCKKVKRKKTSSKAPPSTLDTQVPSTMSVRQLLAEREFGAQYGGLAGVVGASATAPQSLSSLHQPPPTIDASQALANAQLSQRLALLMQQRQQDERLQMEQQRRQQQQQPQHPFNPYPGGGSGGGGNSFGGSASGFFR